MYLCLCGSSEVEAPPMHLSYVDEATGPRMSYFMLFAVLRYVIDILYYKWTEKLL